LWLDPTEKKVTTPTCRLFRTATQLIANGADVVLTPDSFNWDNNQFWSPSVNPSRITIKAPGLYLVGYDVQVTTSTTGRKSAWARSSTNQILGRGLMQTSSNGDTYIVGSDIWYFEQDQYFEIIGRTTINNDGFKILGAWAVAITPEALT